MFFGLLLNDLNFSTIYYLVENIQKYHVGKNINSMTLKYSYLIRNNNFINPT